MMKTFALAALILSVMLAAPRSNAVAKAQKSPSDGAPGMEGCSDDATSPSSETDGDAAPKTMTVLKSIAFNEPTVSGVGTD